MASTPVTPIDPSLPPIPPPKSDERSNSFSFVDKPAPSSKGRPQGQPPTEQTRQLLLRVLDGLLDESARPSNNFEATPKGR